MTGAQLLQYEEATGAGCRLPSGSSRVAQIVAD
jgi:hypothetical protein